MTDTDGLLAAILANPDCDATRLVYADYLQEQGEEARAEFVRVQVELAKKIAAEPPPPSHFGAEYRATYLAGYRSARHREESFLANFLGDRVCRCVLCLGSRSDALTSEHGDDWVPRVNALWDWDRGFVRAINGIMAADWLAHADAILAAHPVTRVTLTTPMRWLVIKDGASLFAEGGKPRMCKAAVPAGALTSESDYYLRPLLEAEWPEIDFEFPPASNPFARRISDGESYPPPLPASPELADAMAVAGLEEQAPVTQADWSNMIETLLRDATGAE